MSEVYFITAIVVLAAIAALTVYTGRTKKPRRLSKLAVFAMLFVFFGIISIATDQILLISYSFLGFGIFLSVIDIVKKLKN